MTSRPSNAPLRIRAALRPLPRSSRGAKLRAGAGRATTNGAGTGGRASRSREVMLAIPLLLAAVGLAERAQADGLIGLRAPDCELSALAAPSAADRTDLDADVAARDLRPVVATRRFEGRVVLVDFWASWCPTCEQSFSFLNALARDYRGKGLEVLAVNLDAERSDAVDFLASRRVEFEVAYDASGRCPRRFGVPGMPTAYLIDRTGRIRAVTRGFRPGEAQALRRQIEGLLREASPALPAVAAGPATHAESGPRSGAAAPR